MKTGRLRKEVRCTAAVISLLIVAMVCSLSGSSQNLHKANILAGKLTSSVRSKASSDVLGKNQTSSRSGTAAAAALTKTIIIDPGHGGPDPGAIGVGGVQEKNLNLSIAKKLKESLNRSGYSVIMTRSDDCSICDPSCVTLAEMKNSDLNNRIKIDTENPRAVFISIHQNYNPNPSYKGTQVYYSFNHPDSLTLAQLIQSEVKKELEPDNARAVQPPENLRVLMKSYTPAILIECGFISNAAEAADLESGAYQDKLVSAIKTATLKFFSRKNAA